MAEDSPLLTPEEERGGGSRASKPLLTPEEERKEKGPARQSLKRDRAGHEDDGPRGGANNSTLRGGPAAMPSTEFGATASAEKYRKIEKVGVGAYGSVYMAENTETKEIVAIKATFRKEDPVLGGFPLSLLREITILRRVKHDNIVQILEIAQTPSGDPLMVMEFCQASLLELLNSQRHDLSFSEVKYVIRQVLDATGHLHERGILHRDLATKNVLFNLSGEIKVCDFGISRLGFAWDSEFGSLSARDLEDPNMIVSLPYRAIELLLGDRRYGPALDVWACGCILAEILGCQSGRRQPFFGGSRERPNKTPQMLVEEIFQIIGRPTDETWPGLSKLPLIKNFNTPRAMNAIEHKESIDERVCLRRWFTSDEGKAANMKYRLTETSCIDLLADLFTMCPADRVTASDALKHSFFTKEKPMPEWHASHWAMVSKEIPRGDKMRRLPKDDDTTTDTRKLMKLLSNEEVKTSDDGSGKSVPVNGKTKLLQQWNDTAEKRKQEEAKRAAERRDHERRAAAAAGSAAAASAAAKSGGAGSAGEQLPKGWTKHWSTSQQKYYYHDNKSGKNLWHFPQR